MNRPLLRVVLLLTTAAVHGCGPSPQEPWKTDRHFVMNHRSGRVFAPQETVPAVLYSVRAGADAVDVDLQKTADDVIVCFHDSWVMTRQCFGPVKDLDWATLSRADVGYEFDAKFSGTRVVTFEEMVRFCAGNNLRFHLESKAGKQIADDVLKIIDRHKAIGLVVDMQGLPRPGRDDYRPVNIRVHTMGEGGDDDRRMMRHRLERNRRGRLTINVEDCRTLADVLDRHPERRKLGDFRLDALPPLPLRDTPAVQLLKSLDGGDERQAMAAAVELVRRDDRSAVAALCEHAAGHASMNVRAVSLQALGRLNDTDSFDLLAKTAESTPKDDWMVPYAAMWALSELDTPGAATVLERVVRRGLVGQTEKELDGNGWYAWDALHVLGRMKTHEAVNVLGFAVRSKPANRYLTEAAAASLARIGGAAAVEHLVTCLDEQRPPHRREIVWALVRLAPESVAAVVRELRLAKDSVRRLNALRVLGWCEPGLTEVPPGLLECLGSTVPEVRSEAAWVCGKQAFTQAGDRLKTLLADEDENVRLDAAQALRRLGMH